jgi:hypothetical protein
MDRTDGDLPAFHKACQARSLRAGEREVDAAHLPAFDQVDMLGQCQHRLHQMQIAQLRGIGLNQTARKKVRLFLIVALDADAVSRFDHGLKQLHDLLCWHDATGSQALRSGKACGTVARQIVPAFRGSVRCVHDVFLKLMAVTWC